MVIGEVCAYPEPSRNSQGADVPAMLEGVTLVVVVVGAARGSGVR